MPGLDHVCRVRVVPLRAGNLIVEAIGSLVPAVMALIRGRFWYHPQWFDRNVPDLDIEGAQLKERLGADAIAAGEHEVAPTPEVQPST